MFKNPLKYQSGGSTPTQQQQDQLVQLFQAAAQNAQVDPEALVKKAQELGQDENAAAQFMESLQLCAKGDPEGIKFIKSLFTQSRKFGGKIQDFICKHARGGKAGCGCGVEKHQQSPNKRVGRGVISEKHTYDDNGGYTGTFSSNGIYGDVNGQPAAAPGIYDTLGRYLPKGMSEGSGPFWVVGQGGSNLGGIYFDDSGYGRTQLDEELARKAAEKIMSRGTYNYKLYPSKGDGGKLDKSSKIDQIKQPVDYSPYYAEVPAAHVSAPAQTYTAEIPAAQVKAKVIKDQEPAGPMPSIPQFDINSINPYRKPGRVVYKQKPIKWNITPGRRFIRPEDIQYEPTFVSTPTEFELKLNAALSNSKPLYGNEFKEHLDSVSSKTGIPIEILKDFGKTRRYLEVYGTSITK